MEVIELIMYIGLAILVGGMIIIFLVRWDVEKTKDMLPNPLDEGEIKFEHVTQIKFAAKLQDIFKDCKDQGLNTTTRLFLKEEGVFRASDLFDMYKELDWCNTIQSASNGCGHREDIVMPDINAPAIVRINCTNERLYIS